MPKKIFSFSLTPACDFRKVPFASHEGIGKHPELHPKKRNRATAQPRNRATAQPLNRATAQPRNSAIVQGVLLPSISLLPSQTIFAQSFSRPARSSRNSVRPPHRFVGRLTMPVQRSHRPTGSFSKPARSFRRSVGSSHRPVGRCHKRVESLKMAKNPVFPHCSAFSDSQPSFSTNY